MKWLDQQRLMVEVNRKKALDSFKETFEMNNFKIYENVFYLSKHG